MENIIMRPLKHNKGDKFLKIYIFPKTKAVKEELKKIDEDFSYEVVTSPLLTIGKITIAKEGKVITKSAIMKTHEVDIYGEEDNLFNKTAKEFGIKKKKKIQTGFFMTEGSGIEALQEAINQRQRVMKEDFVKMNNYMNKVYFMAPTKEMIERAIKGEEVKDDIF